MNQEYDLSDWDWGQTSNKKIRKVFNIPDDKQLQSHQGFDSLCEFLINEIDVAQLVSYFYLYAPMKDIKKLAKNLDCLKKEY